MNESHDDVGAFRAIMTLNYKRSGVLPARKFEAKKLKNWIFSLGTLQVFLNIFMNETSTKSFKLNIAHLLVED
jgi:hypothetical protein